MASLVWSLDRPPRHTRKYYCNTFVDEICSILWGYLLDYLSQEKPLKKLAAFTSFNASIGFAMSPIMFMGGPIVSKVLLLLLF